MGPTSIQQTGIRSVFWHENSNLVHAGMVGTGYSDQVLRNLKTNLGRREQDQRPFSESNIPRKGTHWVKPELVAQVAFTEWTHEGKLRHPRFLGLRKDKPAKQVVREKPQSA